MRPASQPTGAAGLPSPGPRLSPPGPPEVAGLTGPGGSDDPSVCPCAPPGPWRSLAEPRGSPGGRPGPSSAVFGRGQGDLGWVV